MPEIFLTFSYPVGILSTTLTWKFSLNIPKWELIVAIATTITSVGMLTFSFSLKQKDNR